MHSNPIVYSLVAVQTLLYPIALPNLFDCAAAAALAEAVLVIVQKLATEDKGYRSSNQSLLHLATLSFS
jgi:hypothetical protein